MMGGCEFWITRGMSIERESRRDTERKTAKERGRQKEGRG